MLYWNNQIADLPPEELPRHAVRYLNGLWADTQRSWHDMIAAPQEEWPVARQRFERVLGSLSHTWTQITA